MGVTEWLRVEVGVSRFLTLVLTQGHSHATGDIRSGTWEPPRAGSGQNEGPWNRGKKYDSVYILRAVPILGSLCNIIGLDQIRYRSLIPRTLASFRTLASSPGL